MRARVWVKAILMLLPIAAALVYVGTEGTILRGCDLVLRSEASEPVDVAVGFRSRTDEVALPPEGTVHLQLCHVGPFGYPQAEVAAPGRDSVTFTFDRYCRDQVVTVNDTSLRLEPRLCA